MYILKSKLKIHNKYKDGFQIDKILFGIWMGGST